MQFIDRSSCGPSTAQDTNRADQPRKIAISSVLHEYIVALDTLLMLSDAQVHGTQQDSGRAGKVKSLKHVVSYCLTADCTARGTTEAATVIGNHYVDLSAATESFLSVSRAMHQIILGHTCSVKAAKRPIDSAWFLRCS